MDLFNYSRRPTWTVTVGDTPLGSAYPIRVQSMTNTSTMDTPACIEQAKRIVDAGGEYVRLTAQGTREAENLHHIRSGLREQGYTVPLVADIHFNPRVADVAARYVEKVRINPGNYVDPGRTFRQLTYTDDEYAAEIQRIRDRFVPFLRICREHGTAIRIGVNHGSLSDRIMSRYGDTPRGMVESCMEFLRICIDEDFRHVVISIKASNAVVMVRTVRLLVQTMEGEDMHFPLHIGVTEAGDGEDGRIKSALGIGALLTDGLGDTVRVSLSEAPEAEIPVARKLVDYVAERANHPHIDALPAPGFDYLCPSRRPTHAVDYVGGGQVPIVIALPYSERILHPLFALNSIPYTFEELEEHLALVESFPDIDSQPRPDAIYITRGVDDTGIVHGMLRPLDLECPCLGTVELTWGQASEQVFAYLREHPQVVVVVRPSAPGRVGEVRALIHRLMREGLSQPAIVRLDYHESCLEDLQIKAAADLGALIFDGLVDGLLIANESTSTQATSLQADRETRVAAPEASAIQPSTSPSVPDNSAVLSIAYAILQAGRLRTTRTEYISCPSCGRTLYDLQQTIARIKAATSHLVGLKIGIMGCIVNGPGEMADADYGYVGAAPGRVNLYRRRECVERGIAEDEAVDHLIALIKRYGDWRESSQENL